MRIFSRALGVLFNVLIPASFSFAASIQLIPVVSGLSNPVFLANAHGRRRIPFAVNEARQCELVSWEAPGPVWVGAF